MPEKQKILLDTNFLMLPVQNKVDIFSEIARICDSDYSLYVFDKSIDELDKIISTGKLKDRQAAKIAKALIKSKNIDIINSAHGDVDELILESAKTERFIVATLDKELKCRLKEIGIRIITLRKGRYLIMCN